MFEAVRHDFELFLDEEAADRRFDEAVLYDRRRGSVRAVRRAERVVHIHVAVGSELFAEFEISALFTGIKAQVFEENAFSLFARCDFRLGIGAGNVFRERHFAAEQFVQPVRNGFKGKFDGIVLLRLFNVFFGRLCLFVRRKGFDRLFLFLVKFDFRVENVVRLAHVRAEDDFCPMLHQIFDGGKRTHDAVFVGDLAVLHGNVEIAPYENPFAFYVDIGDRFFVHDLYLLRFLFPFTMIYFFLRFVNDCLQFSP